MDYIEVNFTDFGDFDPEIAMAQLSEMGFESFTESESCIQGYIREDNYNDILINGYLQKLKEKHGIVYNLQKIVAQNWNAIWESAYEAVTISGKCQVRAPFHSPLNGIQYDIVIEPKMSFGTAHHETTALMLELILIEDLIGKRVLDMGCGTGVLAILAHKMQAEKVVAIDNDEWAYANAIENMKKNGATSVTVIQGELSAIPLPEYDMIIANINRNVLLYDIPGYTRFLKQNGILLMSGFYEHDLDQIRLVSEQAGLHLVSHKVNNHWIGAKFAK
ncbi:MAG: 50S ribosomal protein L11 methyltransferase [Bacteroidota bacterium]